MYLALKNIFVLTIIIQYGFCSFLEADELDKYGPPKIRKEAEFIGGRIDSFAFSPDGKSLVAGGRDGFFIYHIPSWKEGKSIFYPDSILELTFSPDGKTMVVSFPDFGERKRIGTISIADPDLFKSHLHFYDTATWQPRFCSFVSNSLPGKIRFSPDGKYLVCGKGRKDTEHTLLFWDPASGKQVFSTKLGRQKPGFLFALAFSPDGQWLACGGRGDGAVRLWDIKEKKETAFIQIDKRDNQDTAWIIFDLAFSPDSRWLAISSRAAEKGKVTIVDVAFKKIFKEYDRRFPRALAFSPDGKWLLVSGGGVFETENWQKVRGFVQEKNSVQFSPDGRLLAFCGGGNLEVWDWPQYQKGLQKELMVRKFERMLVEKLGKPGRKKPHR